MGFGIENQTKCFKLFFMVQVASNSRKHNFVVEWGIHWWQSTVDIERGRWSSSHSSHQWWIEGKSSHVKFVKYDKFYLNISLLLRIFVWYVNYINQVHFNSITSRYLLAEWTVLCWSQDISITIWKRLFSLSVTKTALPLLTTPLQVKSKNEVSLMNIQ